MTLRVALVIDGDQTGAKQALDDTATGIGKVETAAGKAAAPVQKIPEALRETATEAGNASTSIETVGTAAEGAGTKVNNLRTLAIGAVGGLAASIAAEALVWASGAVTTAVTDYVSNIVSSGPQVEAALTSQAELVERIKGAFSDAEDAASSYGANTPALLRFEQQQKLVDLEGAFGRGQDDLLSGGFLRSNSIQAGQGPAGSPLQQIVAEFRAELAEGEADIIAFRNNVVALAETLPANDPGRRYATALLADTATLAEVQAEIARGQDLLAGLSGNAEAAATALGGAAENYTALGTAAGGSIANLTAVNELLGSINGRQGALPQSQAVLPLALPGYKSGGGTGDGSPDEIAGFVHRKEFVFDAASTARIGVSTLEAMRSGSLPGYASGGYAGTVPAQARGGYNTSGLGSSNPLAALLGGFSDLTGLIEGARGTALSFFRDLDRAQQAGKSGWEAWGDTVDNVLGGLARKAQDMIVNGVFDLLLGAVTGDFGSGLFGGGLRLGYQAGVGHSGAIIGSAPTSRFVPAEIFQNAPRYHGGGILGQGEKPFIGMEGEEIGWPQDLARKYGGNVEVHVHPTAGQTASVQQSDNGRGGRRVDVMLNEAVAKAIATPRGPSQKALGTAGQLVSR